MVKHRSFQQIGHIVFRTDATCPCFYLLSLMWCTCAFFLLSYKTLAKTVILNKSRRFNLYVSSETEKRKSFIVQFLSFLENVLCAFLGHVCKLYVHKWRS